MGKKNSNKTKTHHLSPAFPSFPSAQDALHWWREKLRDGFPWPGATEHLESLARDNEDIVLGKKLEALGRLTGQTLIPAGRLSNLPNNLSSFVSDTESGRLFISSATGGITCLDQSSGKRLWTIASEKAFQVGGLAVCNDTLYYTDSWRDKLYAVSINSGQQAWCKEKTCDNSPLLNPSGVEIIQDSKGKHLLVCDSGNHRICSFKLNGTGISNHGQRGLEQEWIIHVQSATSADEVLPYFEYPKSLTAIHHQDDGNTIFVWDSGNGRLVRLNSGLAQPGSIRIMEGAQVKPRLAGQVAVLNGPAGVVIAVIDDVRRTLSLRGPLGESLLTIDLAALLKSSQRKLDSFRLDSKGCSEDGILLISSSGSMWRIPFEALDTARLTQDLLVLYPEDCRLVLAHALLIDSNTKCSWQQISPCLDHNHMVRGLLENCDILSDQFSETVESLNLLTRVMRNSSGNDAETLDQALFSRLDEFRGEVMKDLLRSSRLSPGEIERWSDALTEVDMELFQSRGRKSSAELARDEHLEQIREIRPSIRTLGWKLRTLHRLLTGRMSTDWIDGVATMLLDELETNIATRIRIIYTAASGLEFERDTQRVARDEIQAAHAAMLCISALDGASMELAVEFARLISQNADLLNPERLIRIRIIAGKAIGLECKEILSGIAPFDCEELNQIDQLPDHELFTDGILLKIKALLENMVSYLNNVQSSGNAGGHFGKVLDRQRNLFSLKASVLSNFSQSDEDCLELLEQARKVAGDAWKNHRPLRLLEPKLERVE